MAQLQLAAVRTRAERGEDAGIPLMHDMDWWYETEEAFLAEIRENVPPRLLADLASAPLLNEKQLGRFTA